MMGMATEHKKMEEPGGQEVLIFTVAQEEYGIDILKVQEIRGYDHVTRIANTPDFIKGVTNLRGVIAPIIDLRMKLVNDEVTYDNNTVVIVLNFLERVVGIVVDGVSDVLSLQASEIRPVPDFSISMPTEYLMGLGVINERMIILVDIEKLLSSEEMQLIDSVAQGAAN
ncbi:chemotaxis protein CheW [Biostraticola tofi]|uniref:Chemotaxis protein CheW n=1 Tax=Biostraticola tofi TaxID=466109 RepID=A0A4V2W4J1_9GAMM|nr:chemotaxis protein CheW [Biostraticola tofi]TCV95529.1 purine-binding chemotaxis protein CheW [Biostraticola tofi]